MFLLKGPVMLLQAQVQLPPSLPNVCAGTFSTRDAVDDSLFLGTGAGSLECINSCFRVLRGRHDTRMASGLRIHLIDSDRPLM